MMDAIHFSSASTDIHSIIVFVEGVERTYYKKGFVSPFLLRTGQFRQYDNSHVILPEDVLQFKIYKNF